eukprot:jgi/Chrpa1/25904/Chrysochromulina_OHIO_Genome00024543-RA
MRALSLLALFLIARSHARERLNADNGATLVIFVSVDGWCYRIAIRDHIQQFGDQGGSAGCANAWSNAAGPTTSLGTYVSTNAFVHSYANGNDTCNNTGTLTLIADPTATSITGTKEPASAAAPNTTAALASALAPVAPNAAAVAPAALAVAPAPALDAAFTAAVPVAHAALAVSPAALAAAFTAAVAPAALTLSPATLAAAFTAAVAAATLSLAALAPATLSLAALAPATLASAALAPAL